MSKTRVKIITSTREELEYLESAVNLFLEDNDDNEIEVIDIKIIIPAISNEKCAIIIYKKK